MGSALRKSPHCFNFMRQMEVLSRAHVEEEAAKAPGQKCTNRLIFLVNFTALMCGFLYLYIVYTYSIM